MVFYSEVHNPRQPDPGFGVWPEAAKEQAMWGNLKEKPASKPVTPVRQIRRRVQVVAGLKGDYPQEKGVAMDA